MAMLPAPAVGAVKPASPAQVHTVDLASPTGRLRVDGATAGDEAGVSVASVGDINGDGKDDFAIGTPLGSANGPLSGAVYVIFGGTGTAATIDLATATSAQGLRRDGRVAGDELGWSVSGAGDFNGDGIDDLLIGAPYADSNGRVDSGSAYVLFGSKDPAKIGFGNGVEIDGAQAGDHAGFSVASAGDFNGDGEDDVVVGAPNAGGQGAAYVVYGTATPGVVDLGSLGGSGIALTSSGSGGQDPDHAGFAVAGGTSVNGDRFADVVVGAPDASNNSRITSGSAYVVYGSASPQSLNLQSLTSTAGYRIDGALGGGKFRHGDGAGLSVATADVNGDGTGDVIIGAPYADNRLRHDAGSAYVIYGGDDRTTVDLSQLEHTGFPAFRVDGGADDELGTSVAAADLDGDGAAELIVGAPTADNTGRPDSGSTYVIAGRPSIPDTNTIDVSSAPDGVSMTRIDGAAPEDLSGTSVAGEPAGSGGGGATLIGAPLAGNNGRDDSGSAYRVAVGWQLAVAVAGTGAGYVDSSPGGISCGSGARTDCTHSYPDGTSVTLTAHPDASSDFGGFTGGGCSGTAVTCTMTINQARAVTATFTLKPPPQRTLTVTQFGSGAGTVASSPAGIDCGLHCTASYDQGTQVILTAIAAAGSTFAGWSGACSGLSTTCQVTMSADKAVTATFTSAVPAPHSLTVTQARFSGPGNTGSDPRDSYVDLTNTSSGPLSLSGWSLGAATARAKVPTVIALAAATLLPGQSLLVTGADYTLTDVALPDVSGALPAGTVGVQVEPPTGAPMDEVGYTTAPAGYHGPHGGLAPLGDTGAAEYAFVRYGSQAAPADTGDDAADFALVSTTRSTANPLVGGQPAILGSPSPLSTTSHVLRNGDLSSALLDPKAGADQPPNRIITTHNPGILVINRTITNRSSHTLTRLLFRITALSEQGGPPSTPHGWLRAGASYPNNGAVALNPNAPVGPSGGGLGTTLSPATPVTLAPGASLSISFRFVVDQPGPFAFGYDIDAATGSAPAPGAPGSGGHPPAATAPVGTVPLSGSSSAAAAAGTPSGGILADTGVRLLSALSIVGFCLVLLGAVLTGLTQRRTR